MGDYHITRHSSACFGGSNGDSDQFLQDPSRSEQLKDYASQFREDAALHVRSNSYMCLRAHASKADTTVCLLKVIYSLLRDPRSRRILLPSKKAVIALADQVAETSNLESEVREMIGPCHIDFKVNPSWCRKKLIHILCYQIVHKTASCHFGECKVLRVMRVVWQVNTSRPHGY